jgi:lipopolysaccharide/colanic/teichoic acid biosynthesis glycosyltransferase
MLEPIEAFPHMPPDARMRKLYADIFSLSESPPKRSIKLVFDRAVAVIALLTASPIFCVIYILHFAIALFYPDQRGRLLISYRAVSAGEVFLKYKFRVIKETCIDEAAALRGEWEAYAAEWTPENRTYLGLALKQFYLDEIPQLLNVLLGHMSLVGPRPLAERHYQRDLSQGNVFRRIAKAGLFGPSQALKGTARYGNPEDEYKYLDIYLKQSGIILLWYELKLIGRCLAVVAQARGL